MGLPLDLQLSMLTPGCNIAHLCTYETVSIMACTLRNVGNADKKARRLLLINMLKETKALEHSRSGIQVKHSCSVQ